MNSTGSSEIEQAIAAALADRPYSHRQDVDDSVAAVVTVEDDLRFFPDTFRALLRQSVLPGMIVVVDCDGAGQPAKTASFDVIPSPSGPVSSVPDAKTVEIRLVRVCGAVSFADAVSKGMTAARLPDGVRAWWMLHDDSRPADEDCLARLLDAWRNNSSAGLLGAKQLDWQARDLHDVGRYAGHHRVESLVVDGEEDQEQYDSRQDVFAVSLAGALLPVRTLAEQGGVDPWFTTFGESDDFCRRICLDGGRVVVVSAARIAHRRARFEGIRSRGGEPVEEGRLNPSMTVMHAAQKYLYTDIAMALWPFVWVLRLVRAVVMAVRQLVSKRPYEAGCELCMPWLALLGLPRAVAARSLVARHSRVPLSRLGALSVNRQQLAQWRDRAQALEDQRHTILLSPLAKAHLRRRRVRRWGLAAAMAMIAFVAVAVTYRHAIVPAFSGGSLYSSGLLPTAATMRQLAQSATTPWVFGSGTGIPAPPTPWLLVWLVASVCTAGHPALALSLMFFLAAPLAALSFWALAGVFTRSDAVRVVSGLLWAALAMAMGLFDAADLPMLTVMVFLPAAFAFAFRAVAMYRTEDQIRVHQSVQSAALASLCFIPVVAAEPQLLLPLIMIFLSFLIMVRRHRLMLLLMPVPAAFVVAPTLVNSIRYSSEGAWRQLFGDAMVPSVASNGTPSAINLQGVIARAFGLDAGFGLGSLPGGDLAAIIAASVLLVLFALAVCALFAPMALRFSTMMWSVAVCGGLLSLCCARIVVATGEDGDVAASVLPGCALMLLGVMSCACLVSGAAVKRFVPLRTSAAGDAARGRSSSRSIARTAVVHVARVMLVAILTAALAATAWLGVLRTDGGVDVSGSGLPMVASDYLRQGADHRILALRAVSGNSVEYAVMRTARGDLIDSSPAQRVRAAFTGADQADTVIAESAARLMAGGDAEAIAAISRLGFGGIFVSSGTADGSEEAAQRLNSNVTASEGTQSVVASDNGTYYRLTINSADSQNIDTSWQRRTQTSRWRYLWLWCMGAILAVYCLVALPHRTYRYREEES
ncbi:glycosyltransferase family 2 protein [Bifidobacterium amazonense]|uniref:Glycosyltransferase family 2 protein n=1 Tax=Bifidobacterium amazonense TaxID=2809027 RepID=A0ABS9VXZ8_9BIFI|nr:glycosyltransferase family 2 protein [Bifidobacterium amazonense]MCH9276976.1 glycosyltransferase family 2 protein [Bifidobacterium amazonense]